ncbi:MAG TPA: hypothetical protein VGC50_06605 [Gammaproteobacteria bacterium]|jgi:hypothetical protein
MNNVGALALLMPAALQIAARQQIPAGRVLMPLAFGSILGNLHISAPNSGRLVRASDILVIEAEAEQLSSALVNLGLTLEEARR